jgi:hypothetical protein
MSWLEEGAQIGTMLTGLSAVTAAFVWTRNQARDWELAKATRSYRYWNGFVVQGGVFTGFVRLVPNSKDAPPEGVTLDVINPNGSPNENMAHGLRQVIESDGMISRSPSVEQQAFLDDLRRNRFGMGGAGYPVT